ncbi:MvdC/MvdD family ATP grasp protein [Microbulbifer spongiae]|uniref:ATP-grasp domain-containing protein n=1 Tax=Microbulbifer spongiae TaxID=2944933 RepID=A0ABY9EDT3_9GAMM|nr:hypothetical protein [Microbulbifer sp. MI-G]WKD50302.1 hypothetical protein M8T91_02400 [Microbulbifer sp. MI-G]
MKKAILSLTHSGDYYTIDKVNHALEGLGYRAVRLNCDQFPTQFQFSFATSGNHGLVIQHPDGEFRQVDIAGVWMRKNHLPVIENTLDTPIRQQCIRESEEAKNILLAAVDVPWIDRFETIRRAENKLLQLQLAAQLGLKIPSTLISNSPQEVRHFYRQNKGNVVVKMLTPASQSMGRPPHFLYTRELEPEHLENLDGLSLSPMVFQQKIDKEYELRIVYVGGQCFCGKLTTKNASSLTQIDWRQARVGELIWQDAELPPSLCHKIGALMQRLELTFGAIDVIKSPKGYIFLEVNPCGEWGMLEKYLELPIAKHIALALHDKIVAAQIRISAE